jgi:hypothetical protein
MRSPGDQPQPWAEWVDRPLTDTELDGVCRCAPRERPYGDRAWVHGADDRLGLQSSRNPQGHPSVKV